MIKVHGGTRGGKALCNTCTHAHIRKGAAVGQEVIMCQVVFDHPTQITYSIVECTDYKDRSLPSIHEMMKVAWIVNSDRRTGKVGFAPTSKLDEEARDRVDDEVREGNPFRK